MTGRKLKDDYVNKVKEYHPKPNYFINCVKAFFVGGLICTIGEVLMKFYIHYFHFSEQEAGNPTVATLVLLSAILTGCVYMIKSVNLLEQVRPYLLRDLRILWQVLR